MSISKASALSYTEGDIAPKLTAKGRGRDAQRILQLAEESGVSIVKDESLAALLDADIDIGSYIPPWCWEAVAKILAFVIAEEGK